MAINVRCECGEALSLSGDRAGREAVCSECGRRLQVLGEAGNPGGNGKAKRVRALAAGAVALVIAALALWIFASRARPPKELRVIPSGVTALGSVNIEMIRHSDHFDALSEMAEKERAYAQFKAGGLSLDTAQSLCFALDAGNLTEQGEPSVMVLLRNRVPLELDTLAAAFGENKSVVVQKATLATSGGEVAAYAVTHPRRDGAFVLTTLNGNLLLGGTDSMVARAVALSAEGGDSVASNARLMDLAQGGARPEMFWLAAELPRERMTELGAGFSLGPVRLEQIETVLLSLDTGAAGGIAIGLALACESEAVAEAAQVALQATLPSIARLLLETPSDTLAFSREAERVTVSVEIPRETLDRLVAGGIAPPEVEPGAVPWRREAPATLLQDDDG